MASYTRTALKGAGVFLIMALLAGFISYLVRLVLARNLTPEDYGLFYAVFAFFGILLVLRELGTGHSLSKHIAEFQVKRKYSSIKGSIIIYLLVNLVFSLVIFGIILLFLEEISLHFFHTENTIVIVLLGIMFILQPMARVFYFSFQGFKRFEFGSLVEFSRMTLVLIFVLMVFMVSDSIVIPCLAYIFAHIFQVFLLSPLFLRTFPSFLRVKAHLTPALSKRLLSFGIPVMVGLMGGVIITHIDTLSVTYFTTLEDVALYEVAMPTAKLLLYLTKAVSFVVLPFSSELWARRHKKKLREGMSLLYKYSFTLVIPLALMMISFPEVIINLLFGAEYVAASLVLQILAVAGIIYMVCFINNNFLVGVGRLKENTKIILAAAGFNILLDVILVPLIGIEGAAIGTLLSYVLILILTVKKVRTIISIRAPWFIWMKNLISALLFMIVVGILKESISSIGDVTEMIIVGGIGLLFYAFLLVALKVVDLKELRGIFNYALRK
ncbi:MAG: flippase [Candidatus Woesearchaeota archaeon]